MPLVRYLSYVVCRPRIKIPAFVIMPIAHLVERIYKLLAPYGMKVPQLTPSRVRLLSCTRTFDCSKAKDRLGYEPIVTLQVLCLFSIATIYCLFYSTWISIAMNCVEILNVLLLWKFLGNFILVANSMHLTCTHLLCSSCFERKQILRS